AALVSVDVVREREQRLLVAVVPLERDLNLADVRLVLDVGDLPVQRGARALGVKVLDKVDDAAVVLERVIDALAALVGELDAQAAGEEGPLPEALLQDATLVFDSLGDLEVGQAVD